MHKIDTVGATINNLFTNGNPSLGIPATVVDDEWLSAVQQEIVNVIEDQGIALVKGTWTQLLSAIQSMIGLGGVQIHQTITNNQAVATDITGLVFPVASYKAAQFSFEIYRQTDSGNVMENGVCYLSHRTATATWELAFDSKFDDSGVTLSVDSSGQVKYQSDNLAGTSYAGKIRVTGIKRFKQTN